MDESELRTKVADELGVHESRLRDDVWRKLEEGGRIERALETINGGWNTTEVADLADDYLEIEADLSGSVEPRPIHSERRRTKLYGDDKRSRALARILVEMAAAEEELISFRREVLGDKLLDDGELVDWLQREARSQPIVRMERITLPEGVDGYDPVSQQGDGNPYADWLEAVASAARAQGLTQAFAHTSAYETLAYVGPRDTLVRNLLINPGTRLARLKSLANHLSVRYHWGEAIAVAFVLTGFEPPLHTAMVTTMRRPMPALDRIAIEVDPRLAAADVAKIYSQTRGTLWRVRDKEMRDKHLALAVFAELHRDARETWPQLRSHWNETIEEAQPRLGFEEPHPEWQYDDAATDSPARRFAMDCRNAWSRVTGLRWQRATTEGSQA